MTLTIRWAAIVEADHALAGTTATTRQATARVRRGEDVRLVIGGADPTANRDQRLIDLIVEARLAHAHLVTSTAGSLDAAAAEHGHSRKHFSRLLRLATLAPDIVAAILDGRQPAQLSRIALARGARRAAGVERAVDGAGVCVRGPRAVGAAAAGGFESYLRRCALDGSVSRRSSVY